MNCIMEKVPSRSGFCTHFAPALKVTRRSWLKGFELKKLETVSGRKIRARINGNVLQVGDLRHGSHFEAVLPSRSQSRFER